ncbi:MAG: hypothetical protein LBR66_04675 [Candidatus Symbiothrix sp.]|jgi:hypothetical protein|nr:hypothetical protein [Candidatus Symbiothrix sp.]
MNNLEKYLGEVFGVDAAVVSLGKLLMGELPMYIKSGYKVQEATILNVSLCLQHCVALLM